MEAVTAYALSLPYALEDHPFGPEPHVYRVGGKIFALLGHHLDRPLVSVKCDPTLALLLRAQFQGIIPGYHLNKKHWNTIYLDSDVPESEIRDLLKHAYDIVFGALPKVVKEGLVSSGDLE